MPNLVLPNDDSNGAGVWSDGLSIAPTVATVARYADPRVEELRGRSAGVDQVLRSFYDEHGKPYQPSVLIVRDPLPRAGKTSVESLVSFRNAIALATTLRARAQRAVGRGAFDIAYSDTFDFHPVQVNTAGRAVIVSPAVVGLISEAASLHFTHSPLVALTGHRVWPDTWLMRVLGMLWQRRYLGAGRRDVFADRLFRSLEVAYLAASSPARNEASLHEYGAQIAHWVSACEILAWGGERNYAGLRDVWQLLRTPEKDPMRYPPKIPEHYMATYTYKLGGKKKISVNTLQRAYGYMYDVRNAFLHGEPVDEGTMRTRNRNRTAIPRLASTVYWFVLRSYLLTPRAKRRTMRDFNERGDELFNHSSYHEAINNLFGLSDDDSPDDFD